MPEFFPFAHWYHQWGDLGCDLLVGERSHYPAVDEPRCRAAVESCDRLLAAAELCVHLEQQGAGGQHAQVAELKLEWAKLVRILEQRQISLVGLPEHVQLELVLDVPVGVRLAMPIESAGQRKQSEYPMKTW